MTRLFLISERRLLTETLAGVLARSSRLLLVGAAPWSSAPAADLAEAEVLLLDAGVDPRRALEVALELHERGAAAKLVVLGLEQPRQALDFIESGAAAYTLQKDSLDDVLRTLDDVARGLAPCHPAVVGLVFARIVELARRVEGEAPPTSAAVDPASVGLSERETEVLRLLAAGLRHKDVARRLGLALATVRNHVQKVFSKLGAHRRRDAIRRAYEEGILRSPLPWSSV